MIPRKPTEGEKTAAHNFYQDLTDDIYILDGVKQGGKTRSDVYEKQQQAALSLAPPPEFSEEALAKRFAAQRAELGIPSQPLPGPSEQSEDEDALPIPEASGQLRSLSAVQRFLFAGRAIVTVVSKKSGVRYTFRFSKAKEDDRGAARPTFVSVLAGPDNGTAYSFIGTVFAQDLSLLKHGRKSRMSEDAPSAKAARWFVRAVALEGDLLEQCEVYHEGRCGRCSRRLTVPESIESGFGPECIQFV